MTLRKLKPRSFTNPLTGFYCLCKCIGSNVNMTRGNNKRNLKKKNKLSLCRVERLLRKWRGYCESGEVTAKVERLLRKWRGYCESHIFNSQRKSNKMQQCTKFYFIFIWSSTCFGRHTAHHQEPKIALASSGFAYVESCWTCSCWMLTASSNYTSNNSPRMQNQRMLVQF